MDDRVDRSCAARPASPGPGGTKRVIRALDRLAEIEQSDVTRLQNVRPPEWRLHVGDLARALRIQLRRSRLSRSLRVFTARASLP